MQNGNYNQRPFAARPDWHNMSPQQQQGTAATPVGGVIAPPRPPGVAQQSPAWQPGVVPGAGGGAAGGAPPVAMPPVTIPPHVMRLAQLDQQALLALILTELREQAAEGVAYPLTIQWNTSIIQDIPFPKPLFTLAITNDGPQNVQYRVPNKGSSNWVTILPTEVIHFTFLKGVIGSIGLFLPTTGASNTQVRLVGSY